LAVDETHVRIGTTGWYLWAAIDLESKEVLAVHLTTTRAYMDTLVFPVEGRPVVPEPAPRLRGPVPVVPVGEADEEIPQRLPVSVVGAVRHGVDGNPGSILQRGGAKLTVSLASVEKPK